MKRSRRSTFVNQLEELGCHNELVSLGRFIHQADQQFNGKGGREMKWERDFCAQSYRQPSSWGSFRLPQAD